MQTYLFSGLEVTDAPFQLAALCSNFLAQFLSELLVSLRTGVVTVAR